MAALLRLRVVTSPFTSGRHLLLSYDRDMRFCLGTMGYAYDDWIGPFFPKGLARNGWLSYYAQHHDVIEMNTTFHAVPSVDRIKTWRDAVPDHFRFSAKVNKRITHELLPADAVGEMKAFISVMKQFEQKLGPLLLQFPPTLSVRAAAGVGKLIASLPDDLQFVIEFRDRSWLREDVYEMLRSKNIALVMLDHEEFPWAADVPATADFLYIRMVGKHGRYPDIGFEVRDPADDLELWRSRIETVTDAKSIRESWVLFNNDFAGHAPATLRRFAKIAGVTKASAPAPPTLFD